MPASLARRGVRPMRSAVNWMLLGLVIDRSSYGYELAQRFQRLYGRAFPIVDSQVYSGLEALEIRSLVEVEARTAAAADGQPKPRYRATPEGIASYEGWLVAQWKAEPHRQETLLRQLAVFADDPDAALQMLAALEREYLKGAGRAGEGVPGRGVGPSKQIVDALVAEQQRIAVGGTLQWLAFARELFEARAKQVVR